MAILASGGDRALMRLMRRTTDDSHALLRWTCATLSALAQDEWSRRRQTVVVERLFGLCSCGLDLSGDQAEEEASADSAKPAFASAQESPGSKGALSRADERSINQQPMVLEAACLLAVCCRLTIPAPLGDLLRLSVAVCALLTQTSWDRDPPPQNLIQDRETNSAYERLGGTAALVTVADASPSGEALLKTLQIAGLVQRGFSAPALGAASRLTQYMRSPMAHQRNAPICMHSDECSHVHASRGVLPFACIPRSAPICMHGSVHCVWYRRRIYRYGLSDGGRA